MTKLLKKYFLFFAPHPIFYSLVPATVITILVYLINDGAPNLNKDMLSFLLVSMLIRTVLHAVIVYLVIIKFITREGFSLIEAGEEYDDSRIRFITTKAGLNIVYTGPVWGKGKKRYIQMPKYYHMNNMNITASTGISGQFENSQMSVPVTIKLILEHEFDKDEVVEELIGGSLGCEYYSFESYLISVFQKINQKYNQEKINTITAKYAKRELSEPEMLNELINVLFFPEKIFSNVKEVKICIGSPSFSSCKGTSCETSKPNGIIEINV